VGFGGAVYFLEQRAKRDEGGGGVKKDNRMDGEKRKGTGFRMDRSRSEEGGRSLWIRKIKKKRCLKDTPGLMSW